MTSSIDNNEDIRCVHNIVTPVLSSELKPIILNRLQKEITSKIGGSICHKRSSRSDTSKRIGGKKRARESKPSQEKEVKSSQVDGKVNVSMSISESVVRSRLVIGKFAIHSIVSIYNPFTAIILYYTYHMFIYIIGINQCTRALERAYKQQCQCKKNDEDSTDSVTTTFPSLILLSRDVRPATILSHIVVYAKLLNIPTLILPGRASSEFGKAIGIRSVSVAVFLSSDKSGEPPQDDKQKEKEWKEAHNDVDSFVKYVISKIPST